MSIGTIIAKARTEQGMTQEDLARKLYVTRQAVSRWENGESAPSIDMTKLLAVTLNVPITQLLEMPEQPVCQSCGMIMLNDSDYGTTHAGDLSHDYCKWCYEGGSFSKDRSLEEQIEISARGLVENLGYSLEEAVSLMGVALPTLKRWEAVQENERRYGEEARKRYGSKVVDASNEKLLNMDLSEWTDLNELETAIIDRLAVLLPAGDASGPEAQQLFAMHAKWIQGHWPDGAYNPQAHVALARGYLADKRFVSYYDDRAGDGATELLVRIIEANCP